MRLRLYDHPAGEQRRFLGVLVVATDGTVQPHAAEPYLDDYLRDISDRINRTDSYQVLAPMAPGANPRANSGREVRRGDLDFVNAIINDLRKARAFEVERA